MDSKNDKVDENIVVTIRSLFSNGKEVSALIGNEGYILREMRQESGARISITDGSSPDRIITVSGTVNSVCSAYNLICKNIQEYHASLKSSSGRKKHSKLIYDQIILKIIIPAMHCGSLIGKGGCKIKEIRDLSDANVQVGSDLLPFSTERIVTITGFPNEATQAVYEICQVLLEYTMQIAKGAVMPFEPKPTNPRPVIMSKGQAYTIHGEYAIPVVEVGGKKQAHPLSGLAVLGLDGVGAANLTPAALMALSGNQLKPNFDKVQGDAYTQSEMRVPDDQASCIVGKNASRILEIQQISGAQIQFTKCKPSSKTDHVERIIKVDGHREAVSLAQYLINMCIERHKENKDPPDNMSPEDLDKAISTFMTSSVTPTENRNSSSKSLCDIALVKLGELLVNATSGANKRPIKTTGAYRRESKK